MTQSKPTSNPHQDCSTAAHQKDAEAITGGDELTEEELKTAAGGWWGNVSLNATKQSSPSLTDQGKLAAEKPNVLIKPGMSKLR